MDAASPVPWLACALGAGGIGVLRYAWSLAHRSTGWNAAGWLLLLASVVSGWAEGGAWGVAVAASATITVALAVLAIAGARSPSGRATSSNRRVRMLAEPGEPRRIGRRVATFLMVVPGGFAASVALGLAIRGLGMALGWGEANANVLALYTVPLAWAALVTTLLMQTRRSQSLTLLGCGVASAPLLLTGLVS